jgi:hypothetical protein
MLGFMSDCRARIQAGCKADGEGIGMKAESRNRVYVASSWRNATQPAVVAALRLAGFFVYDFREPGVSQLGFSWSAIDDNWKDWDAESFRVALQHPSAQRGFAFDMTALLASAATVLVLPCGRSAHLELGYAVGAGQRTYVLSEDTHIEPELMYLMCSGICLSIAELISTMSRDLVEV